MPGRTLDAQEGIHLTLKFLGEISEAQTKQVVETLGQIEPFEPIPVEVKGFGFFPSSHRVRVLWAGVKVPATLGDIAKRIEQRLEKIGFAREDREFSPHLTLARFQVPRPQPALETAFAGMPAEALGNFVASEFFLFESKLSPQGAQYRKLMRFPRVVTSAQ